MICLKRELNFGLEKQNYFTISHYDFILRDDQYEEPSYDLYPCQNVLDVWREHPTRHPSRATFALYLYVNLFGYLRSGCKIIDGIGGNCRRCPTLLPWCPPKYQKSKATTAVPLSFDCRRALFKFLSYSRHEMQNNNKCTIIITKKIIK